MIVQLMVVFLQLIIHQSSCYRLNETYRLFGPLTIADKKPNHYQCNLFYSKNKHFNKTKPLKVVNLLENLSNAEATNILNGMDMASLAVIVSTKHFDLLRKYQAPKLLVCSNISVHDEIPDADVYIYDRDDKTRLFLAENIGKPVIIESTDGGTNFWLRQIIQEILVLSSIILATAVVFTSRQESYNLMLFYQRILMKTRWRICIVVTAYILLALILVPIFFFFPTLSFYLVYPIFSILAVVSVTYLGAYWLRKCFGACARRVDWSVDFALGKIRVNCKISLFIICTLPLAVTLVSFWFVYRHNFEVDLYLRNAVILITMSFMMARIYLLPALKMTAIVFALFVVCDLLFVFASPFDLSVAGSEEATDILNLALSSIRVWIKSPGICPVSYTSSLASVDILIPGCLIVYVAVHDMSYRIKFFRNLLAALLGHIIGDTFTTLIMAMGNGTQPALPYLCLPTFILVILSSLMFGGQQEFLTLWRGKFPTLQTQ